jgi:hypothetical protein
MMAVGIICALLGIAVLSALVGRQRFRSLANAEVSTLFSEISASVGPEQLKARWDALPEPMRRYFRYVIPKDAPAIRTARTKHGGFFRTKPDQRWLPIEGEQHFTVAEPGFVWNTSVRPVPLLWIEAGETCWLG